MSNDNSTAIDNIGCHLSNLVLNADEGFVPDPSRDSKSSNHEKKENKFVCELSSAGKYSYAVLCGLALRNLYGEDKSDRDYIENFIKILSKHLNLKSQVEATVHSFASDTGDDDPVPLMRVLRDEELIKTCGAQALLHNLLTASVTSGTYDARSRTLAKHLSLLMQVDPDVLVELEDAIVDELSQSQMNEQTEDEKEIKRKQENTRNMKRVGLIAAATVGGGVLLGLTGGLAAPMLAVGLGTLLGTGGAILGSATGVALIGSLFGVAGAGLGAYKMQRRVADVAEFRFEHLTEGRSLHVTIAVPGWLTNLQPDCRQMWLSLADSREQFVLCYETKELLEAGQAMDYLTSFAVSAATTHALQYTILAGVMAAIAWPAALLSASCFIDNPWSVCMDRAVKVGRLLADVLMAREQGQRPVTLIGFSIGARVIFYCLLELAKCKRARGIVEDAILLGTPVTTCEKDWLTVVGVVSGRVINGYCRTDWQLKFVYRTTSLKFDVAGLAAIPVASRRMHNVDLTDVVKGHSDYPSQLNTILSLLGIRVCHQVIVSDSQHESTLHQSLTGDQAEFSNNASSNFLPTSKSADVVLTSNIAASRNVTPRRVYSSTALLPGDGTDA